MRSSSILAWVLTAILFSSAPTCADVAPADYNAFWLWGGVTPSPVLAQARTLYILQGEVYADRRRNSVDVRAHGISIPHLKTNEIWLVYRAITLDCPERAPELMTAQVARWRLAGNNVVGVQIDFDAATGRLANYADFLRNLRKHLPADCHLGITGLLDWSGRIDPATVNDLKGIVDELVIQTYQGRHTILRYYAYLPYLDRLTLPFKIGLVEAGDWTAPTGLATNPWFRGFVDFLVNHK